jgi:microcystin-dependent protein
MTSGYWDGAFSSRPFTLRLQVSEQAGTPTPADIAANTTKVDWTLLMIRTGGYNSYNAAGAPWSVQINGSTVASGTTPYDFGAGPGPELPIGSYVVLGSGTGVTIAHNPDGTKTGMTVGASASSSSPVGSAANSGALDLTTVPRATTPVPSTSTPDTGAAVTLTLTPADSSFTHRLRWAFQPGTGGTAIDDKIVGLAGGGGSAHGSAEAASADGTAGNYWGVPAGTTTPTLTIPHAVFAQSVDFDTRTVTVTVDTYSGSTLIGSKDIALTVRLALTEVPTLAAITDSEATVSPNVASLVGGYVQSVTKLALALTTPAGIYGSTIVSRSISVAGQTLTADGTTPVAIANSGTVPITATVTDSRGRVSATTTKNVTVLAWAPPAFATAPLVVRALASGTADDNGTYLKVNPADFSVSSLIVSTEKNHVEYRLSYRLTGTSTWTVDGSGWIDPANTPSAIHFTGTALSTFASASVGSAYDVLIEIRDVLATSSVQRLVPKAAVLLHLKSSIGVAFGARHSGAANPVEIWGRAKQASDSITLRNIIDQGDLDSSLLALMPPGMIHPCALSAAPAGWLLCDGSTVSRSTYAALFAALNPAVGTVTMTIATPAVVTKTAHGLQTGQMVYLTTTGALPTGLVANTAYFVIRVDANTFNLATTLANALAGTKIATTGSQSGTHTLSTTFGVGNGSTTFTLPNLKGSTVIGVDTGQTEFAALGQTGGEKTHTLTLTETPAHTHTIVHTTGSGATASGDAVPPHNSTPNANFATTSSQGGGGAHNNLNPYLALNYVIKI